VDLPMFALHAVAFPGLPLELRIFEPRYLALLADVGPSGSFVLAAIAEGREVAGPATPFRVGVEVRVVADELDDDDTHLLSVVGRDRVALIEPIADDRPYPRWRAEPYPDEGGAGTNDVEAAAAALRDYLVATGAGHLRPVIPHEPVAASWAIAAATPGLLPTRQALLEAPGAGARLAMAREALRRETRLVRALGSGLAGDPGVALSPN
jgi:Lon protease-like protein